MTTVVRLWRADSEEVVRMEHGVDVDGWGWVSAVGR
jgi:hypothetical protein